MIMAMTAQLGLYFGFFVISVITDTVNDIEDVVAGQYDYGQPMGSLCLPIMRPRSGFAMFSLIKITSLLVAEGYAIAASRVAFTDFRGDALSQSFWLNHLTAILGLQSAQLGSL